MLMKTLLGMVLLAVLAGCEAVPRQVLPYVMRGGEADLSASLDLYLYDLESGSSRVLRQTQGYQEYDPIVDAKGQRVAYIAKKLDDAEGAELHELQVYDLKTGEVVDHQEYRLPMFSPVWSNNGKKIAYVVERDGKLQIEVRELGNNSEPKVIGFGSDPSWRVDDRAIFYSSRDSLDAATGDLMVHELKTGLNQSLKLRGNSFANLARGTSIVYTTLPYSRRNEAVWMIDVNSRQKRLSSPGKTYRDTDPVHINGTKFVAFTRTNIATNQSSIYVVERYATDPVETELFEAKGDAYTSGRVPLD